MGDQPAIPGAGGNGFGFEASEVPELERKEFVTKVRVVSSFSVSPSSENNEAINRLCISAQHEETCGDFTSRPMRLSLSKLSKIVVKLTCLKC